jgi:hypothetical protein
MPRIMTADDKDPRSPLPSPIAHGRLVTALVADLSGQAPAGIEVEREMTIRLDERNRPEPTFWSPPRRTTLTAPGTRRRTFFWSSRLSHRSRRTVTER